MLFLYIQYTAFMYTMIQNLNWENFWELRIFIIIIYVFLELYMHSLIFQSYEEINSPSGFSDAQVICFPESPGSY